MAGKSKAQRAAEKREQMARLQEAADGKVTVYVTERGSVFCSVVCHFSDMDDLNTRRFYWGTLDEEHYNLMHPGYKVWPERWPPSKLVGRSCEYFACGDVHPYRDGLPDLAALATLRRPSMKTKPITRRRKRSRGAALYRARKARSKAITQEQATKRREERRAAGVIERRGRPRSTVPLEIREKLYKATEKAKKDARRALVALVKATEWAEYMAESWDALPEPAPLCPSCGLRMGRMRHNLIDLAAGIVAEGAQPWQWGCSPCYQSTMAKKKP